MDSEARKKLFAVLLQELLDRSNGVKSRLAQQLKISPSRLTPWLQGKVDPAELRIETFANIATFKGCSADELAEILGFLETKKENTSIKFRQLLREMLEGASQDELAEKLEISQNAISKWLDRKQVTNPSNIPAIRMAAIAQEKGWTIEKLLIYLSLKKPQTEKDLFFKLQSGATILSLNDRVKLLSWLSDLVQQEITQEAFLDQELGLQEKCFLDLTPLIILEQENIMIASRYTADLIINLQINPDNIQVTTVPKLPQSLDNIDVLIFDISAVDSPSIPLIEDISFDGDIVVFADPDLSQEVIDRISNRVTEVLVKPIDWNELKTKSYFS